MVTIEAQKKEVVEYVCPICKRGYSQQKVAEECQERGVIKVGTGWKERQDDGSRRENQGEWKIGDLVQVNRKYVGIVIEEQTLHHYIIPVIKVHWNDNGLYEKGKIMSFDGDWNKVDSVVLFGANYKVCAEALVELGEFMKTKLPELKGLGEEQ